MQKIYDFMWREKRTKDKIFFVILIVISITMISYLIWRAVYQTKQESNQITPRIDSIQPGNIYPRFRFPYVAIIRRKDEIGGIKCLGAIWNSEKILTLGKCVNDYETVAYEAIVGKFWLGRSYTNERYFDIKKVIFHPKRSKRNSKHIYSFAIIKVSIDSYDKFVCKMYPHGNRQISGYVVVHGWRRFNNESWILEPMLTSTFMMNKDFCSKTEMPVCKDKLEPEVTTDCIGIKGSPVMKEIHNKQYLIGLALTQNFPCSRHGKPPKMLRVNYHDLPANIFD